MIFTQLVRTALVPIWYYSWTKQQSNKNISGEMCSSLCQYLIQQLHTIGQEQRISHLVG